MRNVRQAKRPAVFMARVVQWDREKGYGFLQVGAERVFLHRRDVARANGGLRVGDKVNFILGEDAQGRVCAKEAECLSRRAKGLLVGSLVPIALLVLPVTALISRGVDVRWAGVYVLMLSVVTYWAYARDKQRAREGLWRLSEQSLHLLELLGGWPGAFFAQRRLRHKCSKASYQLVFWLIVAAYQFAAIDSLQDWRFSRKAVTWIESSATGFSR
jgi:uncharacterized membrane protein YsdA (DUF1294 family)/cold shock CspA family protein